MIKKEIRSLIGFLRSDGGAEFNSQEVLWREWDKKTTHYSQPLLKNNIHLQRKVNLSSVTETR